MLKLQEELLIGLHALISLLLELRRKIRAKILILKNQLEQTVIIAIVSGYFISQILLHIESENKKLN